MIMPNKYIREHESLIGVGSVLITHLYKETSLSDLWEKVKNISDVETFERFILGLDLLFALGLIEFNDNKIIRITI